MNIEWQMHPKEAPSGDTYYLCCGETHLGTLPFMTYFAHLDMWKIFIPGSPRNWRAITAEQAHYHLDHPEELYMECLL